MKRRRRKQESLESLESAYLPCEDCGRIVRTITQAKSVKCWVCTIKGAAKEASEHVNSPT